MDFALHARIYDRLMEIVGLDETFYYVDQILGSVTYRIFLYRLASYTQWTYNKYAIESRGITFALDENGDPWYLASWPFEKFFNYHEVTTDINTLAEALVSNGLLSREVYERAKKESKK